MISYSFTMADRVFTGDTLLIRGTGRTDFQNGDARAQYESIFNRLLKLPEETLVYPAHDYKGEMVSTVGEEKAFNPRLQVKSVDEYVELMSRLHLPNPKLMDVVVPANIKVGLSQEEIAKRGWAISSADVKAMLGKPDVAVIDLREQQELELARRHPGFDSRAVWFIAASPQAGRPAARTREHQETCFPVRLRRAIRHGGSSGARGWFKRRYAPASRTIHLGTITV